MTPPPLSPALWLAAGVVVAWIVACGDGGEAPAPLETPAAQDGEAIFALRSNAFAQGEAIPVLYTCDGDDVSPPLAWRNPPQGTQSFLLIMDDSDAPGGLFTHWLLYDLPADVTSLPEGVAGTESPESGGRHGVNDFGELGYGGPCPPEGPPHQYDFTLYALSGPLEAGPGATREEALGSIQGDVLGKIVLYATYGR